MQAALPSTPASGSYGLNISKKKKKKFSQQLSGFTGCKRQQTVQTKQRVCPTLVLGMWLEVRPGTDG